MTQAEKEQDSGKEKEKEQQRGVKRPIAPAAIPEAAQEVFIFISFYVIKIFYFTKLYLFGFILLSSKNNFSFWKQFLFIRYNTIAVFIYFLFWFWVVCKSLA